MIGIYEVRNQVRDFVANGNLDRAISLLINTSNLFEELQATSFLNEVITLSGTLKRIQGRERISTSNLDQIDIRYNGVSQQILSIVDRMYESSKVVGRANDSQEPNKSDFAA